MKVLGVAAALFLVFWRFPLRLRLSVWLKATRLGYVLWLEGKASAGFFRWQGLRVMRVSVKDLRLPGSGRMKGQAWALLLRPPVKKLEWETVLGLGEAASTAVACGALWGAAGALAARMAQGPFRLTVTPDYTEKRFQLRAQCIISVSIAQIMGRTMAAAVRKDKKQQLFPRKGAKEHGKHGAPD